MLIKLGTALVLVALSAPAFAQALGGFQDIEGTTRRERNLPPQYRTAPSLSTPPVKDNQSATTAPAPAFGSYNRTYGATYSNSYGNPSPTGR